MFAFRVSVIKRLSLGVFAFSLSLTTALSPVVAGPYGGQITGGQGVISQDGDATLINQSSDKLVIEWQNFDTISGETVTFLQPGSHAWALNRVLSGQATSFDGKLFANGNVIIVNGSGIHFGPNAMVDVGSLIASTSGITDQNFLSGNLAFDQAGMSDAMISNAGTITARDSGLAALVAPGVENSGLIQANLGTVILGAGEAHTIDFYGDGLVKFAITKPTKTTPKRQDGSDADALVDNSGTVKADGGTVIMTASQASNVLSNAINMSGVAQANSVGTRGGRIVFGGGGGRVRVSGKVHAKAYPPAPTTAPIPAVRGGTIHITGGEVLIADGAEVDASGVNGGGTVLLGGDKYGAQIVDASLGDLANANIVTVDTNAIIRADATDNGDGGKVIVWGDDETYFHGAISAIGGVNGGDGGFAEVSAPYLHIDGTVNVGATAGTGGNFLIDPVNACFASVAASCAGIGSFISVDTVINALGPGSVGVGLSVQTGVAGVEEGNITIVDAIDLVVPAGTERTLSLLAHNDIIIDASITGTGGGLNLNLLSDIDSIDGGEIIVNAAIDSNGGDISLVADDFDINADIDAGAGTVMFDLATGGRLEVGLAPGDLGYTFGTGAHAVLDTDELALLAAENLIFGNPAAGQNNVHALIIEQFDSNPNITGLVQYNALGDSTSFISNRGDQTYPSVEYNAIDGIDFSEDSVISTSDGDVTFNPDANSNSTVNYNQLRIEPGATVAVNSAKDITIISPGIFEIGAETITFNANGGAGTINIQRSSAGSIGVGGGNGLNMEFSHAQLSRLHAATINFGDSTTSNNTSAINVNGADLDHIDTVNFNTAGTTTFAGDSKFVAVSTNGGTTTVNNNAWVKATDTIAFNTDTVNLDGYLTADPNGISGTATTVNVVGSTGGSRIQDGVDVAAVAATVNVGAGTYAGDVVIKTDDLTLKGAGDTSIIEVAAFDGTGVTIASSGVTIDDFQFSGSAPSQAGIELGELGGAAATNTTIQNNTFNNLTFGIHSLFSDGTTTISGNTTNATVNLSVMFSDQIVAGEVVTITNNDFSSSHEGISLIGAIIDAEIKISGNTLESNSDAIYIAGAITNSAVTIGGPTAADANDIVGARDGIRFSGALSGSSTVAINNNNVGTAATRVGRDGIVFSSGILDTSSVSLDGNNVYATDHAIMINDLQSPSTLSIVGGTYNGTGGALLVDNTGVAGTDGHLNIGNAAYVAGAGANVIEVRTDAGNAGVDIDFNGTATVSGGENGVVLSGPGIDVLGDTFGGISFDGQTGNYIELADGAEFAPGNPTIIDATGVSFDGVLGSAMSVAELRDVESKLQHYPNLNSVGLINTNDLFVVNGESIQLAVNAAGLLAGAQTVNVEAGTFGGSVEVWVDDLTLQGLGATTIIDTDAVDAFANNGDVDNGFGVYKIPTGGSDPSGIGSVSDVTIDGFHFKGTGSDNDGVVLGSTWLTSLPIPSTAIDTTVSNSSFDQLYSGVWADRVFGDTLLDMLSGANMSFGVDVTSNIVLGSTLTLQNSQLTSFDDTLHIDGIIAGPGTRVNVRRNTLESINHEAIGINGGITLDATVTIGGAGFANSLTGGDDAIETSSITLGGTLTIADNTVIDGVRNGIHIDGNVGLATVNITGNTDIDGQNEDGIFFDGEISRSTVLIDGNDDISGGDDAIETGDITRTSTFTVANNGVLHGLNGDGLYVDGSVTNGSTVNIVGNDEIVGDVEGIQFTQEITDSFVNIAGNTLIEGIFEDGILFEERMLRSKVVIGPATVDIDGVMTAFGKNIEIFGGDDAIETDNIRDSTFTVAGNEMIDGFDDGIDINGVISANSTVNITDNTTIQGSEDGIIIDGVDNATVTIDNNDYILGLSESGIQFNGDIEVGSIVNIVDNGVISGFGVGIFLGDLGGPTVMRDSTVTIDNNDVIAGFVGGVMSTTDIRAGSKVNIINNDLVSGGESGVNFIGDISDSDVLIDDNGVIFGLFGSGVELGGGFFFGSNMDNATFTVSNNDVVSSLFGDGFYSSKVIENGSEVNFIGNGQIYGGIDGIHFDQLIANSAVNIIDNDAITGADGDGILLFDAVGSDLTVANTTATGEYSGLAWVNQTFFAGSKNTLTLSDAVLTGTQDAGLLVINDTATPVEIDLAGGNVLTGAPSMYLAGPNMSLKGDTLGDTAFNSIGGGNYIELDGGALFEPGRPTIINGSDALFDGVPVQIGGGFSIANYLETRIVDFDDDNTLGQIFFRDPTNGQGLPVIPVNVRLSNIQAPGDHFLRTDDILHILAEGPLGQEYKLGSCTVLSVDGDLASLSCIVQPGPDSTPYVVEFMARLPLGDVASLN